MRERELEEAFRDGLATLAGEAEVSPEAVRRVRERARSGVVRRRRSGWAVAAAAAAVVAVGTGLSVALSGSNGVDQAASPSPRASHSPSPSDVAPQVPGGYRLEVWHDVAVYVPVTWGWGSAPITRGGHPTLCGGGQVVQADGSRLEDEGQPYVGRPVQLSQACDDAALQRRPAAPYVWLGGDVPVGTVDLGDGWVRQTVEVGDVTVSVASDDAALRRSIVTSAHQVTGECDPLLESPPAPAGTTAPDFVPVSMTVCAYRATSTHLDYDLVYEQELSMGAAKYLVAAVDAAAPLGSSSCYSPGGGEWALLRLRGTGGAFRDYVVDMSCPSIADPTGTQHVLDRETVTSWAVGGVNAVLTGSALIETPDRFIPPLP
ncbi:hypothetical protein SAMN04487968_101121 [Nocardioides terrae]|uniref:Uncharacterized protein n=1 Tax=Nocardioides terrae TaxID=574651 RepID=A0A1I1DAM4_9ACTN|nr:hypothetical protein [Nocardioides terrae]SFB71864.1 hypothetical protein SAMN04487968_101121 [Nocardioides terrae]